MAIKGYVDASIKILADDMNNPHILDEGGVTDTVGEHIGDIIEDRAEEIFDETAHPETVEAIKAIAGGGGGGGTEYTAGEGIDISDHTISVDQDVLSDIIEATTVANSAYTEAQSATLAATNAYSRADEAYSNADTALSVAYEVEGRTTDLEDRVDEAVSALEGKQDTLTPGEGISIENNVISATGGGGGGEKAWSYYKYTTWSQGSPQTIWLNSQPLIPEDWEEIVITYMWNKTGSTTSNTGTAKFYIEEDLSNAFASCQFMGPTTKDVRGEIIIKNYKQFDSTTTANRVLVGIENKSDDAEPGAETTSAIRIGYNKANSRTDISVKPVKLVLNTPNAMQPTAFYIKWR